jgi:dipeptidase E
MKLFFSSFMPSAEHDAALARVIGKPIHDTKVAYIENAYDVYNDEASLIEGRQILKDKGYDVELVDLRQWKNDRAGLREKLAGKDIFLFTGGNPYYLRWVMKESGADDIIRDLVKQGKVYSGASAGAVVAGPTLRHFDELDDPNEAGEIIWDGLGLTDIVIVPHVDNADFGAGCRKAGELLKAEGYKTQQLTDAQAFLINGDEQQLI